MGTISSGIGLISGINTAELIDQLIAIESRPKQLVQQRVTVLQTQQTAWQDINARLLALKLSSSDFSSTNGFSATNAVSSNESVFTASSNIAATPGTYSFTVSRLVTSQQTISKGFADATSTPVAPSGGTFTFEFGDARLDRTTDLSELNAGLGVSRGKIRITDRSGASALVDLSTALTVNDVIETINNTTSINVNASVSGDRLVLTDLTGATTAALSVQNVGTTNTATSLGLDVAAVGNTVTGNVVNTLSRDTKLSDLNEGHGVRTVTGNDIRVRRSNGQFFDLDLDGLTTVGAVIDHLNASLPVAVRASLNDAGNGLKLTDTVSGVGFDFEVLALNGSNAAADLGILGVGESTTSLTGDRLLGSINSRLVKNLFGGAGATLGLLNVTNRAGVASSVDLTNAASISEVVDAINASITGVTASLNDAGNGLKLTDTTGSSSVNLQVSGAAATALNLDADVAASKVDSGNLQYRYISDNTLLSTLNGGAGITRGKFQISDSSGATAEVDLSQGNEVTIKDVIAEINSRGLAVNARVNDNGDGIVIEDTGPGTLAIKVEESGSTTARDLGLLGEASAAGSDFVGSFESTVTLEATDTLQQAIDKINAAGLDVRATLVNDGSANAPYRLSLLASQSGRAGAFLFDDGGLDFQAQTLTEARNAVVFYGSTDPAKAIAVTSTSNSLSTLIPGATIDLKGTSASPVQLIINRDTTAIAESVNKFVTDFNAVIDAFDKYDTYDAETQTRGLLLGDPTIQTVRSSLYRLISSRSTELSSTFTSLTQVGVTVKTGGKLSFDQAKFLDAFESDPTAVQNLFTFKETEEDPVTGEDEITAAGLGVRIDELLENITDSQSGSVQLRIDTLEDQVELNNDRIAEFDVRLEAKRARLEAQFVAMERALANLQSQSSSLSSLASLAAQASASVG